MQIIVNNAIYIWDKIKLGKKNSKGYYELYLQESPKVMNRRKYPRLPIANACRGEEFAESVGESIHLKIDNFPLAHGKNLQGVIIRSSNNAGTYIVGCRMMQDNPEIEEYVKIKM